MVVSISRPSQDSLLVTPQVCQTRSVTTLVLASTSPARLILLRSGGIEPLTIAPGVDEDAVAQRANEMGLISSVEDMVHILAKAKAEAVAALPEAAGALVIGCDSALEFAGEALGKPHEPQVAIDRWMRMRGQNGTLHTGHWLIDNRVPVAGELSPATGVVRSSKVHFADLSDAEIETYVATGEPLQVAGAFTIDGLGGAFIESIEGDSHTVVGLSLGALREMVLSLGVEYTSLWNL
ncbi:MAG: septum formation inhibitor Maf [Actinobacteria bacterium]|nr:septum formation inhibitor Maf [Actinomycetota bacterium]